jgi:hypothetical protein
MPSPEIGIPAGASLLGGYLSSSGQQQAAGTQAAAADRAAALQERIYNSMAARNLPAESAGNLARDRYLELIGLGPNTNAMGYGSAVQPFDMSKFQADPGYEYRLAESQKAEDRIASRNRNLFGSAALANAQRNRQGMASQEFGNAYNRYRQNRQDQLDPLMYAMTGGTNATNATNTAMGNYGTNVGNLMGQAGQATAAGQMGAGNTYNNAIQAALQGYQNNQMMDIFRNRRSAYDAPYNANTFIPMQQGGGY